MQLFHQRFGLADAQIAFDHGFGGLFLSGGLQTQQGAGVTGGQLALGQQGAHGSAQIQQAQDIGHIAAAFAHPLGGFFLRQIVVLHQHLIALGFFDGVQILALEVFDHGQLHGLAVVGLNDQHRHLGQARHPGGPPAALAGDDLIVARGQLADGQRLDNAVLTDGFGQILQRLIVEVLAGLLAVGFHLGDGQHRHAAALAALGGEGRSIAQQGAKTLAKPLLRVSCHRRSPFTFGLVYRGSSAKIPPPERGMPRCRGRSGRRR